MAYIEQRRSSEGTTTNMNRNYKIEKCRRRPSYFNTPLISTILPSPTEIDDISQPHTPPDETQNINVDEMFSAILPRDFQPVQLPDNVAGISALLGMHSELYQNLTTTAVQLRGRRLVREGGLEKVAAWLYALWGMEQLDPRYKDNSKIDKALEIIMDEKFNFPAPFPEIASEILIQLNEANWGEEYEEMPEPQPDPMDTDVEDDSSAAPASSTSTPRATQSSSKTSTPQATQSSTVGGEVHIEAADDDPIFGVRGIMHDIEVFRKTTRKSYRINEDFHKPSSKVFGHNGIPVGTVYPLQIAAFRDGAHGRTVGGISGTVQDGCYSIIVSGFYDSLDRDLGHTLYYSDSKALTNKSPDPEDNSGTKSLRRSITTRLPVRVLRSSGGTWNGRPTAGLRYDGLYRVVAESTRKNPLGGGFVQFKLERIVDEDLQGEIIRDRPTAAEVRMISRVQAGITRRR